MKVLSSWLHEFLDACFEPRQLGTHLVRELLQELVDRTIVLFDQRTRATRPSSELLQECGLARLMLHANHAPCLAERNARHVELDLPCIRPSEQGERIGRASERRRAHVDHPVALDEDVLQPRLPDATRPSATAGKM